ncbi:MAG: type II toxin-antitoxin system HicA family toxin [Methanobacteriaceae archaeon]|nr:type II toxin-antitoxin system HicA family toxin [Methanobacteriaceae archaeon]MDP2836062.1 type II toxin-antitoxin system HicA family toxin [Methanobacteriaceae archaeon]MDP3035492.1 type II toxin-antitoxin system HicA family toxin [Methanobacteriaceae archaeon]MDP3485425.1 type II toxin-antitoxin system HicA family toxin [Methanobacteriaceae archaeon]MDP3623130.1 type II toxin-antitoxin system HicA family toxin [Methanobacteriaceae archaeon]
MCQVLNKAGFTHKNSKGSHVLLKKESSPRNLIVTIPLHKEIKRGTLNNILKQANMSLEEFLILLKK